MTTPIEVVTKLPANVVPGTVPPLNGYIVQTYAGTVPPTGGGGSTTGLLSYATAQTLTSTQANTALKNIGAAKIIEVEQYNVGTTAQNFQAALNDGAGSGVIRHMRLRSGTTYALGTTSLAYDETKGDIYIDARGAQITYTGSGHMWDCSNSSNNIGGGRLIVEGGLWTGTTASHGWFLTDCRRYRFRGCSVNFPAGIAFYQVNVNVWSERNQYFEIDDRGCKQVWVGELGSFGGTGTSVTITASTDLVSYGATAHNKNVGDEVKFSGLSGGAPLVNGTVYYVHTVPSGTTFTLTTDPEVDTLLNITSDGTGTSLDAPSASMARTIIKDLYVQGGNLATSKIEVRAGVAMYASIVDGVRGNITNGAGIMTLNGNANGTAIGNLAVEEAGPAGSANFGTGYLFSVGTQSAGRAILFGNNVYSKFNFYDPAMSALDVTKQVFTQQELRGVRVIHSRQNDGIDFLGRVSGNPTAANLINTSFWNQQGGGSGGFASAPWNRSGDTIIQLAGRASSPTKRGFFIFDADLNGLIGMDNGGKVGLGGKAVTPVALPLAPTAGDLTDLWALLASVGLVTAPTTPAQVHSALVNNTGVNGGGGTGDQILATATTIPASLLTTNTFIRYSLDGTLDAISTSGTMTVKVKIGTTVLTSGIVAASITTGATNMTWHCEGVIYVTTTGTSGVVSASGTRWNRQAAGTLAAVSLDQALATSVNLNSGLTINITGSFATANAGNVIRLTAGYIEHVR